MEDALVLQILYVIGCFGIVLILVLMEDALVLKAYNAYYDAVEKS